MSTDCLSSSIQLVYTRKCEIIGHNSSVKDQLNVTTNAPNHSRLYASFAATFWLHQDIITCVNTWMTSRHTFLWRNIIKNRGKEVGVWGWVVHTASYGGLKEKKRLPREKEQRRKETRNEPWKKRLGTFCFRDTCKKVRDYGPQKNMAPIDSC